MAAIQHDVISYMESSGIDSGEHYVRRKSSPDILPMLKARIGALSYVGSVNLFDSDGMLINSSVAWPIPDLNATDRQFFRTFRSDPQSLSTLVELVQSRITGARTAVVARKLTDRNGEFIGVIGRGVETSHFEKFFASVALGQDAAITMFHRDGTLLARHDGCHLDELLKNADLAMYDAKNAGRRTWRFFAPEMDRRAKSRRVMEEELRQIIAERALAEGASRFIINLWSACRAEK